MLQFLQFERPFYKSPLLHRSTASWRAPWCWCSFPALSSVPWRGERETDPLLLVLFPWARWTCTCKGPATHSAHPAFVEKMLSSFRPYQNNNASHRKFRRGVAVISANLINRTYSACLQCSSFLWWLPKSQCCYGWWRFAQVGSCRRCIHPQQELPSCFASL